MSEDYKGMTLPELTKEGGEVIAQIRAQIRRRFLRRLMNREGTTLSDEFDRLAKGTAAERTAWLRGLGDEELAQIADAAAIVYAEEMAFLANVLAASPLTPRYFEAHPPLLRTTSRT